MENVVKSVIKLGLHYSWSCVQLSHNLGDLSFIEQKPNAGWVKHNAVGHDEKKGEIAGSAHLFYNIQPVGSFQ